MSCYCFDCVVGVFGRRVRSTRRTMSSKSREGESGARKVALHAARFGPPLGPPKDRMIRLRTIGASTPERVGATRAESLCFARASTHTHIALQSGEAPLDHGPAHRPGTARERRSEKIPKPLCTPWWLLAGPRQRGPPRQRLPSLLLARCFSPLLCLWHTQRERQIRRVCAQEREYVERFT